MAFHWPRLAKAGFGTCQIRQIIDWLGQVNIGLENVRQGLTHAEWELEAGNMRDKSGQQVSKPVDWVFAILAKQGYYRKPEGYVSPSEQAELDAAEEAKKIASAHEEHLRAECDAWVIRLSPEERLAIQGGQSGPARIPGDVALRNHFRAVVWPKIQNGGAT
jgi:hypothetical protein